ncbi:DUF4124 domain-containing protein [Solimonas marina]|uniref:DUF4124 domain-containing protein n=1 Tax=Solimonas marina TaxID=2714601 RepID=A0A969W9L8_9GAMM|nr:DUF4124 domain-containing protein [Solimonas marina]NKF22439.1 DUF4124 domain-containing protein [Solimonas marina]
MLSSAPTQCATAAALVTALLMAPAEAGVYRCTVDGVTRYSDQPCQAGDTPVDVPDANVVQPTASDALAEQHDRRVDAYRKARAAEDADWREQHDAATADAERIRNARVRGEAAVGMTEADLRGALGTPDKTRTRQSASGTRETWSYRNDDGSRTTVTLQDGIVSKVSRSSSRSR